MQICLNGEVREVYSVACAEILIFESETPTVQVEIKEGPQVRSVRPLGLSVPPCSSFTVPAGSKAIVEFETGKPLFLFTYLQQTVDPADYTYYFAPGEHRLEELQLKAGDKVYLAGGAVLRTHICADGANDISISGRGMLDTTGIGRKKRRQVRLIECDRLCVSDITLVGAVDWALVPIHCDTVDISGVNIVTWEVNGDGIDVVGCKNVSITDCFMYCADDCIAVKATDYDDPRGCNNCENIRVQNCVFWNIRPGNAMEIGFETRCEEIRGVTFAECDVLHCDYEGWESGGVFTIHNGDRALIHDVRYEHIRVENAQQKLFDFKVLKSRYSKDEQRGFIRDIAIKDVFVFGDELPPSILRGSDNDHGVKNVRIDGLYHDGKKVENMLSAHIITESGSEVFF